MSKQLIEALGGHAALASEIKQPPSVVWNWADRDAIPWRWRPAVAALAKKRRIEVPSDFLIAA